MHLDTAYPTALSIYGQRGPPCWRAHSLQGPNEFITRENEIMEPVNGYDKAKAAAGKRSQGL